MQVIYLARKAKFESVLEIPFGQSFAALKYPSFSIPSILLVSLFKKTTDLFPYSIPIFRLLSPNNDRVGVNCVLESKISCVTYSILQELNLCFTQQLSLNTYNETFVYQHFVCGL